MSGWDIRAHRVSSGGRALLIVQWLAVGSLIGVGAGASVAAQGSVLDGVFTSAQATRGERIFERVCTACHDTNELSGRRFRLTWVGRSTGDLFDTVSTLMPEGDPGSLSPDAYAALVAFLLQLNGYPAGEVPLPVDPSALELVQIEEGHER